MNRTVRTIRRAAGIALLVMLPIGWARDASAQDVLLIGAEDPPYLANVEASLASTGLITGTIDQFSAISSTPSLSTVRAYDAVMVWSDYAFADATALGDVLADYVDCGGGVILATFGHYGVEYSPEGRFASGGYPPIQYLNTASGTPLTLGTVFDAAHPVMASVTSFSGGSASFYNTGDPSPGTTLIANWSNGRPLVVEMPGFAGRIIGLNFFPVSSAVSAGYWNTATHGARLLANAVKYVEDTTPPTGVLSATAVNPGMPVAVQATASCIVTARLNYRKPGGDPTFDVLDMVESAPGVGDWTATIPGVDVSPDGVQYYVELDDGRTIANLPAAAPAAFASVRVNRTGALELPAGSYVMTGVPFAPTNPAPEAVFDELGPYNREVWRYGTFDPSVGACVEPPSATGVVPGQGFWVISKDATTINVAGRSTDLVTSLRVTLRPGFNQIANPYSFPIAEADLILDPGIERNLISWSGGGYDTENDTFAPLVGYWIKNNGPGNRVLEIPLFPSPAALPRDAAPTLALADGESGWSVRVDARAGAFFDGDHRFGSRPGATESKDAFDFSDPPPPPAGYAALAFVHEDGVLLTSDYRAAGAGGAQWTLRFSSDQAAQPFRIAFEPEGEFPVGWQLVALAPSGLRSVDLTSAGALVGTVGEDPFHREWTIVAGTAADIATVQLQLQSEATAFALSRPISNPGSAPTLDLALPEAAHVSARVFDVSGRLVGTISEGPMSAGNHAIVWNGEDTTGRRVADGVYFVRVRAADRDESRKVVLRR